MKRFIGILLFCACLLGLTNVNPAVAIGNVTKIQVTHSHAGGDHPHEHDGTEQNDQSNDSEGSGESGTPHTHEILLTSSVFYFSTQPIRVLGFEPQSDIFPEPHIVSPPRDPSLGSIFRPPIA